MAKKRSATNPPKAPERPRPPGADDARSDDHSPELAPHQNPHPPLPLTTHIDAVVATHHGLPAARHLQDGFLAFQQGDYATARKSLKLVVDDHQAPAALRDAAAQIHGAMGLDTRALAFAGACLLFFILIISQVY